MFSFYFNFFSAGDGCWTVSSDFRTAYLLGTMKALQTAEIYFVYDDVEVLGPKTRKAFVSKNQALLLVLAVGSVLPLHRFR